MHLQPKTPSFLAGVVWPQETMTHDLMLVFAGSWLIALMAQISLPIGPVPLTGQTFGVLLVGAVLGSRRGMAAVLAYLAQGVAAVLVKPKRAQPKRPCPFLTTIFSPPFLTIQHTSTQFHLQNFHQSYVV